MLNYKQKYPQVCISPYLSFLLFREGIFSKLLFIRSCLILSSSVCHNSWLLLKEQERKIPSNKSPNIHIFLPSLTLATKPMTAIPQEQSVRVQVLLLACHKSFISARITPQGMVPRTLICSLTTQICQQVGSVPQHSLLSPSQVIVGSWESRSRNFPWCYCRDFCSC